MNEAIRIAIEKGGYRNEDINSAYMLYGCSYERIVPTVNGYGWVQYRDKNNNSDYAKFPTQRKEQLLLDPLFWQALGKTLGWEEEKIAFPENHAFGIKAFMRRRYYAHRSNRWLYHALRYHELALTGSDTSKFWKDLLK